MEAKRYILSSDRLNRNGYRVLTNGIKTDAFQKNPVLLLSHMTWGTSIGRVDDLQIEGGNLTGIPVFDENDPVGLMLKKKCESGHPIALSIGFRPLQTSATDVLPGQQFETVTECELLEVSVVTVPGNPDAVGLSANSETPIPAIPQSKKMEKSAQLLGLAADAGDDALAQKIAELQAQSAQLLAANQKATADSVLALGASKGMVTDANRATYEKLAMSDPDSLKAIFESAPAQQPAPATNPGVSQTLAAQIRPGASAPTDERAAWGFEQWSKQDPNGLLVMKQDEPDKYKALAAAYQPSKA